MRERLTLGPKNKPKDCLDVRMFVPQPCLVIRHRFP